MLQLEKTIALPNVEGRIDHLSIDIKGQRLFVAALGNKSIEVIDLKAGAQLRSIPGLPEPQGILYEPGGNRVYVANRGDGGMRILNAATYEVIKTITYAGNADNVRYDAANQAVYVGYGSGVVAAVTLDGELVGETKLDAHPESFQLEKNGPRIFVNLPGSRKIGVLDRNTRKVTATWNTGGPWSNYPMTLDEEHHRLFVVCRLPARLVVLNTDDGRVVQSLHTVGDSDDVFYDAARKQIYVIGGEGAVAVVKQDDPDHYRELGRAATINGARTGFYSPELDRLYVACRREGNQPAAIRVYTIQK